MGDDQGPESSYFLARAVLGRHGFHDAKKMLDQGYGIVRATSDSYSVSRKRDFLPWSVAEETISAKYRLSTFKLVGDR